MNAQIVPRDGLGFPIVPIVMGASTLLGLLKGKKPTLTRAQAEEAVRQVFLELLEREPDAGAKGYVDCLLRREDRSLGDKRFGPGTCNIDDVRTNVLKSDEYRRLQEKKAAVVYGAAAGPMGAPLDASGAPVPAMGLASSSVAGIPLPYLAGGLLLLMLLKRR